LLRKWLFLGSIFLLFSCGAESRKGENPLLIAAASNVQFAMGELIADFKDINKIDCDLVVSSSGKITSQISSGATFDVFVSADQYYPEVLFKEGLTEGKPIPYAKGKLVYWSKTQELRPTSFSLADERFSKIAIANPKLAPYGIAAMGAIESMGFRSIVEDRLVFGENISQVNQFISVGAADIGLTSQSILYAKEIENTLEWLPVPDSLYSPILQDMVTLKNGRSSSKSRALFKAYITSPSAKNILRKYGYDLPDVEEAN
jgi:molybdate transport system substrate-binding protein